MFNNIGKKIQTLAKVICWVGIIFTVLLGAFCLYGGINTYNYEMIANGIILIILGPLSSWISSLTLFGFGELVDSNKQMKEDIEELKNKIDTTSNN